MSGEMSTPSKEAWTAGHDGMGGWAIYHGNETKKGWSGKGRALTDSLSERQAKEIADAHNQTLSGGGVVVANCPVCGWKGKFCSDQNPQDLENRVITAHGNATLQQCKAIPTLSGGERPDSSHGSTANMRIQQLRQQLVKEKQPSGVAEIVERAYNSLLKWLTPMLRDQTSFNVVKDQLPESFTSACDEAYRMGFSRQVDLSHDKTIQQLRQQLQKEKDEFQRYNLEVIEKIGAIERERDLAKDSVEELRDIVVRLKAELQQLR